MSPTTVTGSRRIRAPSSRDARLETIEARAGALLARAVKRDPLPAHKRAAIALRLRRDFRVQRVGHRRLAVNLAAGISVMIAGGALAATASHYFLHRPAQTAKELPATARPAPVRRSRCGRGSTRHLTRRGASAAGSSAAPTAGRAVPRGAPRAFPERYRPAGGPVPGVASAGAPGAQRSVPPSPAEPGTASGRRRRTALADESKLLMSALAALRRDKDAGAALALLDEHDRRFPRGELAGEATRARVEALLKERRLDEALALLENLGTGLGAGEQRKLSVTRAELRAATGQCAVAIEELDRLLRRDLRADALTERALWSRAACRAARGDAELARGDLERYLTTFPSGRFAAAARAALAKDP